MLYKVVSKKRLEETEQYPELEGMIIMLELCKESYYSPSACRLRHSLYDFME